MTKRRNKIRTVFNHFINSTCTIVHVVTEGDICFIWLIISFYMIDWQSVAILTWIINIDLNITWMFFHPKSSNHQSLNHIWVWRKISSVFLVNESDDSFGSKCYLPHVCQSVAFLSTGSFLSDAWPFDTWINNSKGVTIDLSQFNNFSNFVICLYLGKFVNNIVTYAICRRIFWVCLTILWNWRLKG